MFCVCYVLSFVCCETISSQFYGGINTHLVINKQQTNPQNHYLIHYA